MRRKPEEGGSNNHENKPTPMELKYCERCGGLWVRESGTREVYCRNCQRMVNDLPSPKKKPQRIELPLGQRPLVERYQREEQEGGKNRGGGPPDFDSLDTDSFDDDSIDLDSAGGAA